MPDARSYDQWIRTIKDNLDRGETWRIKALDELIKLRRCTGIWEPKYPKWGDLLKAEGLCPLSAFNRYCLAKQHFTPQQMERIGVTACNMVVGISDPEVMTKAKKELIRLAASREHRPYQYMTQWVLAFMEKHGLRRKKPVRRDSVGTLRIKVKTLREEADELRQANQALRKQVRSLGKKPVA
jgi:hypothetical protein